MSAKGRFQIPTIEEMAKSTDAEIKVASLFEARRQEKPHTEHIQEVASKIPATRSLSKQQPVESSNLKQGVSLSGTLLAEAVSRSTHPAAHNAKKDQVADTASSSEIQPPTTHTIIQQIGDNTKASKSSNSLIVSPRQRGNPILKYVRNVPWEFGNIVPDYVMGHTMCAIFLSLRYHALNPDYIHKRLSQLGHSYELRVLLAQVDTKDPHHALKELGKMCIMADCTLILAWTPEEAGRYLETYKSFENKPPDLIMERTDPDYFSQLTDCLTAVRKVNKTDAMTMLTAFGSMEKIICASEEDLSLCSGLGPQKAKRLSSVFREPFLVSNKRKGHNTADTEENNGKGAVAGSPTKTATTYITRSPWKKRSDSPLKKS